MLIAGAGVAGSLLGHYIAKGQGAESAPYLLIGGFLGSCLAEMLIDRNNNGKHYGT